MNVRERYVRYLCNLVNCSSLPEPGKIVLSGKELWSHPHVEMAWRWFLEIYEPPPKPVALILPCTPKKPYNATPLRRIVYVNMARRGLDELVQVYTASDPMGLVPRDVEDLYPFANYDHPPELLADSDIRRRFIELLSMELPKLSTHRRIVVFAPRRYEAIIEEALARSNLLDKTMFVRYTQLAFRDAKHLVDVLENVVRQVW